MVGEWAMAEKPGRRRHLNANANRRKQDKPSVASSAVLTDVWSCYLCVVAPGDTCGLAGGVSWYGL